MTPTPKRRPFATEHEALTELGAFIDRSAAATKIIEDEYAAKWTTEKRQAAVKSNDALPGGKFPIRDQEDMNHAAGLLGNSTLPKATVVAHMRKQAKKHSLTLPKTLQGSSTS